MCLGAYFDISQQNYYHSWYRSAGKISCMHGAPKPISYCSKPALVWLCFIWTWGKHVWKTCFSILQKIYEHIVVKQRKTWMHGLSPLRNTLSLLRHRFLLAIRHVEFWGILLLRAGNPIKGPPLKSYILIWNVSHSTATCKHAEHCTMTKTTRVSLLVSILPICNETL